MQSIIEESYIWSELEHSNFTQNCEQISVLKPSVQQYTKSIESSVSQTSSQKISIPQSYKTYDPSMSFRSDKNPSTIKQAKPFTSQLENLKILSSFAKNHSEIFKKTHEAVSIDSILHSSGYAGTKSVTSNASSE